MRTANKSELIQAALHARQHAQAPYSNFKVGAALVTLAGEIVSGANVESASYSLSCCAERVALFKALSEVKSGFQAVAVVARLDGGAMPCGACRQLLFEYAKDAVLWVADSAAPEAVREFTVAEVLPGAFSDFRQPHK